jgi:hypothetical protein
MRETISQPPERTLTRAERANEARRMAHARVIGGVRRNVCPQCGARPYGPLSAAPGTIPVTATGVR